MNDPKKNNSQYRKYLIDNAEYIINKNFEGKLFENNTLIFYNNDIKTIPYQFEGINDISKPKGFTDSVLKSFYQIKQQVESLLI